MCVKDVCGGVEDEPRQLHPWQRKHLLATREYQDEIIHGWCGANFGFAQAYFDECGIMPDESWAEAILNVCA